MKKGVFLRKTHFWLFLLRPREGYINNISFPADVREISKSMFAAQENIMSLFTCAHVYVRMCEGARMYMYACVKIFHWRLINI